MTESEQQVAEALRTITFPVGGGVESFALAAMDDEHINRLAPRVAAAIKAATRETANYLPVTDLATRKRAEEWGFKYALAALWGR